MKRIEFDLAREMSREYMRRGLDSGTAQYHGARMARIVVSRMESGAPEDYWTVGMDGFFKKLVKTVTKPFKKAASWVEKEVIRPVAHEIERVPRNVEKAVEKLEKEVIRPVAHWKYLSVVANAIPGYGPVISAAISAAQTLNQMEKMRRSASQIKGAEVEFEKQAAIAYREYQEQVLRKNIMPMSFYDFKNALITQSTSF